MSGKGLILFVHCRSNFLVSEYPQLSDMMKQLLKLESLPQISRVYVAAKMSGRKWKFDQKAFGMYNASVSPLKVPLKYYLNFSTTMVPAVETINQDFGFNSPSATFNTMPNLYQMAIGSSDTLEISRYPQEMMVNTGSN